MTMSARTMTAAATASTVLLHDDRKAAATMKTGIGATMMTPTWSGSRTRPSTARRAATMSEQQTAFVLSGGGTKGAFEVGVLGYLVHRAGLVPDIITTTSAGSIIGAKLAQARGADELAARTDELRRDLLAMTDQGQVFAKQPWLADFDGTPFGAAVDTFITMRPPPPTDPDGMPVVAADARAHHRRTRWHALQQVVAELPSARHAKKDFAGHQVSLLTLDPLGAALRGESATAAGISPIDEALVARPGVQLRMTVTALETGECRYVTEHGVVVERDGVTPTPESPDPIGIVEGVLTSSSVPMVFAPRRFGAATYVDGGVCQNVPVEVAVSLGATKVVAVLAVPLLHGRDPRDFLDTSFLGIYQRCVNQIAFAEKQRENLGVPRPDGCELVVIEPTVDTVGAFEVNEGLMRIDLDYGALRAEETLADLDDETRARAMAFTDRAVVARDRAWYHEEDLWSAAVSGQDLPTEALVRARRAKADVREALAERASLGLPVPDGAEAWWGDWEAHVSPRPDPVPPLP
jgi:predicted acylesterase/phospholipase RssA